MKRCNRCGHSRAAHVDGVRCALCGCTPQKTEYVQDAFSFKTAILTRATANTRKR